MSSLAGAINNIKHDMAAAQKKLPLQAEEWKVLASIPLFSGMPQSVVCRLTNEDGPRNVKRGIFLFHQGEDANDLYVVLSGWLKLFRTGEGGTETIIRVAGAGDVLGEAEFLLRGARQFGAQAISPARILSIDGSKLAWQMRRDPSLVLLFATSLSAQVQRLTKHVEEIKLFDAIQRTAHYLIELCPERTGAFNLSLPYEKAVIAGWLGMTPASFSRALAQLRDFGVTVDRDVVSISEAGRLAELILLKS